ncbi:hypothetical protein S40288_10335 [Stachybotrys chartarum IBT 40288]|nr:hypothetical protein S40288_10335 [Stachybotrys chartarum IBT 40288]
MHSLSTHCPAEPDRAEFEQQYAKEPNRWFSYLSDAYAWMKDQAANQADTDWKLIKL